MPFDSDLNDVMLRDFAFELLSDPKDIWHSFTMKIIAFPDQYCSWAGKKFSMKIAVGTLYLLHKAPQHF